MRALGSKRQSNGSSNSLAGSCDDGHAVFQSGFHGPYDSAELAAVDEWSNYDRRAGNAAITNIEARRSFCQTQTTCNTRVSTPFLSIT